MRLAWLTLLVCASSAQDPCEFDATTKANAFASTWNEYAVTRRDVNGVKVKERMRRQFDAVMRCECF